MTILTLLYKFFIGPLELFFEVVYAVAYRFLGDPALAIVALSLAMNILVLPLYRRADAVQEEQRDRAIALKPWTDHIKKTFKGDERFMMLQTYNRQNGYKQTDVLKGSISLLLEIPFFIAAFHFLSNLELLHGIPLGPIADLGAPDALLQIGGISINLLPILMTLINVVSAALYLKGFPLTSKIQTYGIAAIFLILLYNSPAGLVFYWTLNNMFSLVKNVFYKLQNPKRVLAVMLSILGVLIPLLVWLSRIELSPLRIAFFVAIALGLQIPLILNRLGGARIQRMSILDATSSDNRIFFFGSLFIALLVGLLIPVSVIQTSPAEFVNTLAYRSPLWLVAESFALSLGTFVLWCGVFYRLATPKWKTIFCFLLFVFAGTAIINYLFFGTNYGNLSSYLQYSNALEINPVEILVNIVVLAAVALLLFLIWRWRKGIARVAYLSLCTAAVVISLVGVFSINTSLEPVKKSAISPGETTQAPELPRITLSKTGKNVVVIMLDRAVPGFVPYMVNEKPELKDSLSGFTVYTNAYSYSTNTNGGSPALFGGSDYRPQQMNERKTLSLGEKQNEALKLMPNLFSKEGYDSTIFDPPYAGYSWVPDLNIYNDIPNAKAYVVTDGRFRQDSFKTPEDRQRIQNEQARNLFCYGIFRTSPVALHYSLYMYGGYNSTKPLSQIASNSSVSMGIDQTFMNHYSVLQRMPEITELGNNVHGNLFIMTNDATHWPSVLEEPSFEPKQYVDNRAYDKEHEVRYAEDGSALQFTGDSPSRVQSRTTHYAANMASMLQLGKWCDYLRELGVYDNTRIIVVSDHSWPYLFNSDFYLVVPNPEDGKSYYLDMRAFNCMLMVKDFNSSTFSFDEQFMTNADVPVLAMDGIVENPVNPYTSNPINSAYKDEPAQYMFDPIDWNIYTNNGNVFKPGYWYEVKNDASKPEDWKYLGTY